MIESSLSSPSHNLITVKNKGAGTSRVLSETHGSARTQLLNGEHVTRPMEIQKGDGIHALPWKWSKLVLNNPDGARVLNEGVQNGNYAELIHWREDIDASAYLRVASADMLGVSGITPELIDTVRSSAILKAQANLRKNVASLPLIFLERKATLATAKKYSTFILNNAITMQRKDVKKWLSALRRRTPKNRLKALANQIANTHLEFVFGVMPLIDEITESVKHFSKPEVTVRTGRGRDRRVIENVTFSDSSVAGAIISVKTTTRDDFSVRTDLRCDISSKVANNASLLGFNPLYVLYDNHPLSFIIGWFSNFNTWLASLDPLVGLDYVTGSSSVLHRQTVEREFTLKKGKANTRWETWKTSVTSQSHSGSLEDFTREVHTSMPGIQSLRLMDKTSLFTHAAAVSLLVQRLVNETKTQVHRKPFLVTKRRPNRYLPPIQYRKVKL